MSRLLTGESASPTNSGMRSRGWAGAFACPIGFALIFAWAVPAQQTATPRKATHQAAGRGAAAASAASAPATFSPRDLKYQPLRTVQTPKTTNFVLPNGMKLYLVEQHELPVLGGVAMIRTGGVFDPPDRIGLAAMTGTLLRSGGTSVKTGEQVDETIAALGMTMESSIGETSSMLSFSALADRTDPSLALVKEVLTQSEFRQDRLEQAKAQMRSAIGHRNDDLTTVAQRELRSLVFGKDTPNGWHPEYATIERITRTDLKNFYKRYFFPANMMLGIWGDLDTAQMKAKVEALFADWTVQQSEVPAFPKTKSSPVPGLYLAEKQDAPESYFAVGHLGGSPNQKDFPALEVMGLLFDQMQARITQRASAGLGAANVQLIRVSLEKVSGVWGAGFDHQGVFRISTRALGASTVEAIRAIQADIEGIRTAEVSEEELRVAKEVALSNLAENWAVRTNAFARMMSQEYYGYPRDFTQQYQAGIMAVTRGDVLRVAKEYVNPANLTIVVVGNPQVFIDPLEKLNPTVNRIDLKIPESKPVPVERTDVTRAEGRRLLLRAQEAAGGAAKLAAVTDAFTISDYRMDAGLPNIGGAKIVETDRWINPTTFRQDVGLPGNRLSVYTDGKTGWVSTPQGQGGLGWGALTGTQLKQTQGDLFRWYFRLLLSDRLEGRTINAVDQDLVEISDTAGQIVRVEFEPKTGLPMRITYDVPKATGAPVYTVEMYEDYRDVDGIKFPFKATVMQGGRKFADVTVTDCKINSGLKQVDLARRQ